MAQTFKNINTENTGGAGNPPFSSFFSLGSWTTSGSDYIITVLESTHGLGIEIQVQVFEESGIDYTLVDIDTLVTATGDVVIKINQIPDNRFEGKITIIGA